MRHELKRLKTEIDQQRRQGDRKRQIGLPGIINFQNRIAVVELESDLGSGVVVTHITDPRFDIPTTIDEFGKWLYAVNARFTTPPTPTTTYTVVQVEKD